MVAVATACAPAPAAAHPLVDQALGHIDRADFLAAQRARAEMERAEDLTRDDVIELLRARALVRFAVGSRRRTEQDLVALASLDPQVDLGPRAPPELQRMFERSRELARRLELSVSLHPRERAEGYEIAASLTGDAVELVARTRISLHVGDADWRQEDTERMHFLAATGTRVEYVVEGIGMGDAVLVRFAATVHVTGTGVVEGQRMLGIEREPVEEPRRARDQRTRVRRITLGTSGAALAATVFCLLAFVSPGFATDGGGANGFTTFEPPRVAFP